jgi:hypothetical protein
MKFKELLTQKQRQGLLLNKIVTLVMSFFFNLLFSLSDVLSYCGGPMVTLVLMLLQWHRKII